MGYTTAAEGLTANPGQETNLTQGWKHRAVHHERRDGTNYTRKSIVCKSIHLFSAQRMDFYGRLAGYAALQTSLTPDKPCSTYDI